MAKREMILIMGLGLHGGGIGAANYFIKKDRKVLITDLKSRGELRESIEKLEKSSNVKLVLGRHRYRDFRRANLIVKNPAVRFDSPFIEYARKRGIRVDSDIGIFLEEILKKSKNIIGITGTKGKSTTASLIHRALSSVWPDSVLAGNIGISVFDAIEKIDVDTWIVLELSSFQLGSIREKRFSPHVAVITNFMKDHLNYYSDMREYFSDKEVIYRYQKPGDILVVNRDQDVFKMIKPTDGVRVLSFGLEADFDGEGTYRKGNDVYFRGESGECRLLSLERIKLRGIHNLYNIMAAATVCTAIGVEPGNIERAFDNFNPLEHRLEIVYERSDFRIINDTAATTPDAAVSAIRAIEKPIFLIAGGYDKELPLEGFVKVINDEVDTLALLAGNGTERMMKMGIKVKHMLFYDLEKAVEYAIKESRGRGTVILSPGFASFGMFKNEFHRGDEFKRIVKELLGRGIV